MVTYIASRISSNDNTLYPDMIEIGENNVIYSKGYVFGYKTTVIARSNIASISARAYMFFADVIICSKGGEHIVAQGFKKSAAREIVELLTM